MCTEQGCFIHTPHGRNSGRPRRNTGKGRKPSHLYTSTCPSSASSQGNQQRLYNDLPTRMPFRGERRAKAGNAAPFLLKSASHIKTDFHHASAFWLRPSLHWDSVTVQEPIFMTELKSIVRWKVNVTASLKATLQAVLAGGLTAPYAPKETRSSTSSCGRTDPSCPCHPFHARRGTELTTKTLQ